MQCKFQMLNWCGDIQSLPFRIHDVDDLETQLVLEPGTRQVAGMDPNFLAEDKKNKILINLAMPIL